MEENQTKELKFSDYEKIIDKTAIYPNKGNNVIYPLVSLGEEVGECLQILAKSIRDKNGILDEADVKKMKKEIGDVLWQATALCHEIGTTLEEVAIINYSKLIDRLERDVIKGSGDSR